MGEGKRTPVLLTMSGRPTPKSAWDVLQAELVPAKTERPAGSVTARELADELGLCTKQAHNKLQALVRAGKLRTVRFHAGNGGSPTVAYVPAE